VDDDADALALALGASKLWNEVIVHCPVIRPELVAELQEIEVGVMATCWTMTPNADALAFVYALLNGRHPRSLGCENS
jgi:hypothetical protein